MDFSYFQIFRVSLVPRGIKRCRNTYFVVFPDSPQVGSWSLDAEGDMPAMDPITCLERPRTLSLNTMSC